MKYCVGDKLATAGRGLAETSGTGIAERGYRAVASGVRPVRAAQKPSGAFAYTLPAAPPKAGSRTGDMPGPPPSTGPGVSPGRGCHGSAPSGRGAPVPHAPPPYCSNSAQSSVRPASELINE
ncbi:hypothetical protein GCM10010331_35960 [Streptomyces xanthochromogenes]|nr:hypothetical protein GCM10010331_35960 [Streptomyces xanthochromogenes]